MSPVEDFTIFAGFSCLNDSDTDRDLEDFIRNDAQKHFVDKIAVTYQLFSLQAINDGPIGFATLQNDAIVIDEDIDFHDVCKKYDYRAFPAVKIGRLAIRFDLQGKSLGKMFLTMLKEMFTTNNRTGCRFVTVDARRDKKNDVDVRGFYSKCGFSELACRGKTSTYVPMYFDLATFQSGCQ